MVTKLSVILSPGDHY